MAEPTRSHAARLVRVAYVLGIAFVASVFANSSSAQAISPAPAPLPAGSSIAAPQPATTPRWSELTPAQKQALAPLESEWDKLEGFRKSKWLVIGNKFASMTPDEQQRVQERMRDWVKLTPEQRRLARENYVRTKKLQPDQKSAQWEQYQQLPDEEKKKLAEQAAAKKHVATLPPPAQRKDSKTVPPIKAAPKPVLQQSVTPQAASQSALPPAIQPNK